MQWLFRPGGGRELVRGCPSTSVQLQRSQHAGAQDLLKEKRLLGGMMAAHSTSRKEAKLKATLTKGRSTYCLIC